MATKKTVTKKAVSAKATSPKTSTAKKTLKSAQKTSRTLAVQKSVKVPVAKKVAVKKLKTDAVESKLQDSMDIKKEAVSIPESRPATKHRSASKNSWWAVLAIFLLLVCGGVVFYNFNNDFRSNINSLMDKAGLSKLINLTEKNQNNKLQATKENFQMKLNIVYNQNDVTQKETISSYLKNIEANLNNTTVVPTWYDKNDEQGKALIAKLDAKYLPIFTTDEDIKKHPQYSMFADAIKNIKGELVFQSEGIEYLKTPEIGNARYRGADPKKAKLVVMEYASMTCGYCKMMNPVLNKVMAKYGKDITLVTKHYNRGGIDTILAQASECVADNGGNFDKFVDSVYSNQSDLFAATQDKDPEGAVNGQIAKLSKAAGANSDKVASCIKSGKYASLVDQNTKEGQEFGIIGTPSLFVGDKFVGGAMDEANFTKLVEEKLQK